MSFEYAGVSWDLQRIPADPGLRAWDAADEYLLDEAKASGRVLILNDSFGALACALNGCERVSVGDSFLARAGLRSNEAAHEAQLSRPADWKWWDEDWGEGFDLALVKIPKHESLLVEQLTRLRTCLAPDARVMGGAMTRNVHTRTVQAFERIIGPTVTTKARRKARLILSEVVASPAESPPLRKWDVDGLQIVAHPGVFSGRRLDAGTALLLKHLPEVVEGQRVVDLGCGTGAIGAAVLRKQPSTRLIALDESRAAWLSTRDTLAANGLEAERVDLADGLSALENESVDLLLSNPPQHQNTALGRALFDGLLADAARVLAPGGRLRMVANRHVNLNRALAAHFSQVAIVAQDRQYMVVSASHPLRA